MLSKDPYKGVRDFYPPELAIQNYLFGVMKKTSESFGYVEYGASILEPAELYRGKTSEEIVNEQTYTFTDRGKREVTLRPEMTPTIARMIAAKRRELALPLRWYAIPNVFRYERPQRGRLREHWQLNCDIFGVAGVEAETEIISLAYQLLKNFGAKDDDFEIRVNNRKIIAAGLAHKNLSEEQIRDFIRKLDKGETIPTDIHFESDEEIKKLLARLKENGINNVRFDETLARGFDYYTGIVFEVFDTSTENNRSLFGGGRYDNLLEIFDEAPIPAVGFGMGDVTIRDFLETHKLLPVLQSTTEIYLCNVGVNFGELEKITESLRAAGLRVAIDLSGKKVGDQIKIAVRQQIPYIICVGEEELKTGQFKLKKLATGEEKTLKLEEFNAQNLF
ncbi:MAG TPA: histidine--tRNA ligase [Candidatus Paceibacterota bacterium]